MLNSPPQLAEALYLALKQRSTGCLEIFSAGRRSALFLERGDLVGSEMAWGFRTPVQCLLAAGLLDALTVDQLWARGERTFPGLEVLQGFGLDASRALEVQMLAQMETLSSSAESIRFEEKEAQPGFEPISAARLIRAMWRTDSMEIFGRSVFRCVDPALCEPWVASPEDRTFLRGFEAFKRAEGASPSQLALLDLLCRDGTMERVEASAPAGPEEISWADLFTEDAPVAQPSPGQTVTRAVSETEATKVSRVRTQEELVREMNEALRRSATPVDPEWADLPDLVQLSEMEAVSPQQASATHIPAPAPPSTASAAVAAPTNAAPLQDASFWQSSPPAPQEVRFYGPAAPDGGAIQQAKVPAAADPNAPLEDALRRMDENVGELIDLASHETSIPVTSSELNAEEPRRSDPLPAVPVSAIPVLEDNGGSVQQGTSPEIAIDEDPWFLKEDDLASDPADPSRARRQRLLRRSMENLGAPGTRSGEPASIGAVAADPPNAAAESVPAETDAPTSDEREMAEAIEARFQAVQAHQDYFQVLGVPRTASVEQLKGAFLELAKVFHPDWLPASLRHLSPKMTAVFESVREAYEALDNDAKRATYLASLAPAEKVKDSKDSAKKDAEEAFKRGDSHLRRKDYFAAEQEYQLALDLDPNATYLASAAWALYMDPARRQEAGRARQMMADAIKRDPKCDRAHYQLGVIARVEGDMERAERHFREAIRARPKHPEANQELRLIEMRKKNPKRKLFRRGPDES